MDELSNPARHDGHSLALAGRFLRIFSLVVLVTALVVASVNLVAYRYMLRDNNQDIVQLLAGWGRMYKPILYDEIRPEVAVFGASWARDAFDPIETSKLIGRKLFNHAVSGGTAYETRRFGDAALDNPRLEAAIVNLDTFYRSELVARIRYGFDESILDVDPDGNPNSWVGLRRAYSLALTGWAVGANLKLISNIRARDDGANRPDYLRAYEQADHTRRRGRMKQARERIFPKPGSNNPPSGEDSPDQPQIPEPVELELMIDRFCARGIDIYAYFTPSHVRQQSCDPNATEELAALELLRRKQSSCSAKISYFDFAYPNAVTLEGVLTPVKSSQYYRPDGHPRPTAGLLMAARMFASEFPPGTPALLQQDFGIELMSHADAPGWLRQHAARCRGDWGETDSEAYQNALTGP
jgi:hypothetical protein